MDASGVVWALGVFLFHLFYFILITTRHESPRQPMTANEGQRRPTQVNEGPQLPMTANEDKKGPNDASGVVWALGVFLFHLFYFILITTRHESPRQPMTANEGQRRPTAANTGPQRPTAANDGQRRPTQAHEDKKGPNDASGVVWALGVFFFKFYKGP